MITLTLEHDFSVGQPPGCSFPSIEENGEFGQGMQEAPRLRP